MSDLAKKEQQAIKLLKSIGNTPVEVCFSGGKDSEVILALAQAAGLNYRAIYKNTTIDPPGTIAHCLSKGVEVLQPKQSFLQLIEKKGIPTRRARFCCECLKEYKVMDNAIHGVRRGESQARAKRYHEPQICRIYPHGERVSVLLPILEWSNEDVAEFITANGIKCHALYYDETGNFHAERRLGCMGCQMKSDNGVGDFKAHPKLLRAWIRAAAKWWNAPREKEVNSKRKFASVYDLVYHNLFCHRYIDYYTLVHGLWAVDTKQLLEDYFKVDLTI